MHVTKMHLAFLNSIGKKGTNPKLANTIISTIHTHARIQEEQQKAHEAEAHARELAREKALARQATSLDCDDILGEFEC